MAENQYNSKIVLSSGEVLMDLTQDTVVADKLLKGFTAHGKDGAPITGSCEFDADTGDATAGAAEILAGKTAYVTNGDDNTVSVIDVATMKPLAAIPVGKYPHGLRASPDGKWGWSKGAGSRLTEIRTWRPLAAQALKL